eukprot:gnl/TRDRNA2_/TRDRNA2_91966_c0_seq1.p1 gnl/TRDRNA2_/TRDRNA2_91966_c0~~gnl/TRDRNA2_/TRDRNA2_91966_c0_seq1.p1  ORF type:complete len:470 (+),score=64.11 gnl/TRDRNA2_/TRDRNA2_91966_c0_seq1:67-1476(+)
MAATVAPRARAVGGAGSGRALALSILRKQSLPTLPETDHVDEARNDLCLVASKLPCNERNGSIAACARCSAWHSRCQELQANITAVNLRCESLRDRCCRLEAELAEAKARMARASLPSAPSMQMRLAVEAGVQTMATIHADAKVQVEVVRKTFGCQTESVPCGFCYGTGHPPASMEQSVQVSMPKLLLTPAVPLATTGTQTRPSNQPRVRDFGCSVFLDDEEHQQQRMELLRKIDELMEDRKQLKRAVADGSAENGKMQLLLDRIRCEMEAPTTVGVWERRGRAQPLLPVLRKDTNANKTNSLSPPEIEEDISACRSASVSDDLRPRGRCELHKLWTEFAHGSADTQELVSDVSAVLEARAEACAGVEEWDSGADSSARTMPTAAAPVACNSLQRAHVDTSGSGSRSPIPHWLSRHSGPQPSLGDDRSSFVANALRCTPTSGRINTRSTSGGFVQGHWKSRVVRLGSLE